MSVYNRVKPSLHQENGKCFNQQKLKFSCRISFPICVPGKGVVETQVFVTSMEDLIL